MLVNVGYCLVILLPWFFGIMLEQPRQAKANNAIECHKKQADLPYKQLERKLRAHCLPLYDRISSTATNHKNQQQQNACQNRISFFLRSCSFPSFLSPDHLTHSLATRKQPSIARWGHSSLHKGAAYRFSLQRGWKITRSGKRSIKGEWLVIDVFFAFSPQRNPLNVLAS
jgi:hypothetical protein